MIKKFKYTLIFSLCCLFVITGCSNNNKNKDKVITSNDENIESSTYVVKRTADMLLDTSNDSEMYEESSYVAIVTVESIVDSDNYSYINNEYVLPYTHGKMKILKVLKGDLKENTTVDFYRSGGTLTTEKYYEGLSELEKVKFNSVRANIKELSKAKNIKVAYEDDIDVILGKPYLVYLKDDKYYSGEKNSYVIFGMQGGLREIQTVQNIGVKLLSEVKVLNNFTKKWETLDKIVK